jgi:hypothetical protein
MNSPLLIPKNILIPVAIFGLLFTVFFVTFDLSSLGIPLEASKLLIYLGMACNFFTVIILIVDVFKNNVSTKYLWTLAFLLTGCFAGLYYLLNREKWAVS